MTTNELVLKPQLTLEDIIELTRTEGDAWKLSHVRRVLKLIGLIGEDMVHDHTAVTIATYLHDWGAYPRFQQPGVEHALRSRQVAESLILPRMDLADTAVAIILETIEYHDYRDFRPVQSTEAVLLREADFLDFLGIIGLVREYGRGPKDVESACRAVLKRRELIQDRFTLPIARYIAATRLARLAQCLEWLQEESFEFV
ncbi:MAG TPA: HD domain-containing protein [Chloroflexota bacterium]|nr:HD domain-containing protein [Chloroflexota bacterium]